MKFNKKIFHDVIINCKETLKYLEILNDPDGNNYTTRFLQNGIKHLKALKELKVLNLKRVVVIKGKHPSLKSIEMIQGAVNK